jgi:hypothetical protein
MLPFSIRSTAMLLKLLEAVPHHAGRGGELRRAAEMRVHDLVKAEQTRLAAVATYAAAVSGGEGFDSAAEEALRHSVRTHIHTQTLADVYTVPDSDGPASGGASAISLGDAR